jgi:UDP-N-acetyl-D-mannosaminuronate dehydrogenase
MTEVLIVGYGEVGKPLFEIVRGVYPEAEWLDVQEKKIDINPDVMHICFQEQNHMEFVSSSVKYIKEFLPELVLVESTVTPGTTLEIYKRLGMTTLLCHSPVRGNMTDGMKKGLMQYTKFIGPVRPEAGAQAKAYYETLGIKTCVTHSPLETELGKIFETTYRGLMMSWFQEISRICGQFDARYDEVVDFVGSTEREGKQARPVFHPGVIGGHCIIPNAERLYSVYPSKFAEALLESNRKRQEEVAREAKNSMTQAGSDLKRDGKPR